MKRNKIRDIVHLNSLIRPLIHYKIKASIRIFRGAPSKPSLSIAR